MRELTSSALKAVTGTSLKGYIDTTYDNLCMLFGEPYAPIDNYKVDVQWIVRTPHGHATIYNYKNSSAYLGLSGLRIKAIERWHVGAKNYEAFAWVRDSIKIH